MLSIPVENRWRAWLDKNVYYHKQAKVVQRTNGSSWILFGLGRPYTTHRTMRFVLCSRSSLAFTFSQTTLQYNLKTPLNKTHKSLLLTGMV